MNGGAKLAALNKFKSPMPGMMRQMPTKLLIVYDVVVKTPDVPQVPLVINYGTSGRRCFILMMSIFTPFDRYRFTKGRRRIRSSVRSYSSHLPIPLTSIICSVAPAIAPNYSRAGVVINFVTATGGDVEMLRSIECFYKYVLLLNHAGVMLTYHVL